MITSAPQADSAALAIVVSRGQSRNPEKRAVESALLALAEKYPQAVVVDLPHLYDLQAGSEALASLRALSCDLVVASWIFPRAAHWLLDRLGIDGQAAQTRFDERQEAELEDEDDEEAEATSDEAEQELRVTELYPRRERKIYCLDMRAADAGALADELKRLLDESLLQDQQVAEEIDAEAAMNPVLLRFEDTTTRRWYPVIDYSRCTNCMECVDFCLFGVYGLDGAETILVEQPDNCRKGCPACSRVCPANAIMFPQHKAPAIAGAAVAGDEGFKIDLSLLFGAPEKNEDAATIAARERDEQLLLAGRNAVGAHVSRRAAADRPKDDLDLLIDKLDDLNL